MMEKIKEWIWCWLSCGEGWGIRDGFWGKKGWMVMGGNCCVLREKIRDLGRW